MVCDCLSNASQAQWTTAYIMLHVNCQRGKTIWKQGGKTL